MISIIMATYNGEKYISEQIESILNQTVKDFRILIYDDCSTDSTTDIVSKYQEKFPEKIKLVIREKNTGNAAINFFEAMKECKDDYIMLCDQDDVWLPEKIEKSLCKIKQMEEEKGVTTPILVHTDLCVVDGDLNVLDESYIHRVNADYSKNKINNVVIQNILTGGTAMYNRALANIISGNPQYMVMHDWWLILIAATFGKVDYISDATILYRQHSSNVIGSTNMRSLKYMFNRFFNKKSVVLAIRETYEQAKSFYEVYCDMMNETQKSFFKNYIEIPHLNKISRIRRVIKLNTFKNGFLRNVAYILYV